MRTGLSVVSTFFLSLLALNVQSQDRSAETPAITDEDVIAAVSCIAWHWGREEVRRFSGDEYLRARYIYGILDPDGDKPNTLHLLLYSKKNSTGIFYEPSVTSKRKTLYLELGLPAEMEMDGQAWRVKEAHGGMYSYLRIAITTNAAWKAKELRVPFPQSAPSSVRCKFLDLVPDTE